MKKLLIFLTICILCFTSYLIGYNTTTTTTNLSLVKPDSEDTTTDWFDNMNDNLDLIDAIFDTVSLVEFNYLDGVTSAIQTQLAAKQPLDAQLTDIAGLTPTDSYFIVGDGVNFVTESGATARTSLGIDLSLHYLKTEIDTLGEVETIYGADIISSTELSTYCETTQDYLKTSENNDLTDEQVQDKVGAMWTGNTETLITLTYQDADGTIDAVVDNNLDDYDNTYSEFITKAVNDLTYYYLKTAIDTQGEVETIWGVTLATDTELTALTYSDVGAEQADAGLTSLAGLTYVSPSFIKLTADDTYAIRTIAETKTDLSLNLVENTALSTWAGTSNITTLGTIGTGTWQGTAIANAYVPNDITIDLATLATNFTCTDNESENLACPIVFVDGATGTQGGETDGDLTYNPSTGKITATGFVGALTGNADTCTTASAGDAAVDFFGAGVNAVTDATECTDIEGTLLSITTGTLNAAIPEDHVTATMLKDDNAPADGDIFTYEVTGTTGHWMTLAELSIQPLDTALTNISALTYVSPSFIKLTADDTYAVRTLAEVKTDLAYQLSDMSDVGVTTPTNTYALMADGDSWESRALVEADISDLGAYLTNITGESIGNLSDVDLTGIADTKILKYNSTSGNWEIGTDEGGAGATEFTGLTDTPANYTGGSLKFVRVNVGETALEFAAEADPTVDTDAEIKAILVDEVTKTGAFTAGKIAKINNATGIIEQGTNTDTEVTDAVTKKHTQNTDTAAGGEWDFGAHSAGFTIQTATGDGTTTIDWRLGNKFKFTFGAQNETFTFTAPTNPCTLMLTIIQDATGSRTITWPATVKWPGGTAPTLTTTANARDKIALDWDGTQYDGCASLDFK